MSGEEEPVIDEDKEAQIEAILSTTRVTSFEQAPPLFRRLFELTGSCNAKATTKLGMWLTKTL